MGSHSAPRKQRCSKLSNDDSGLSESAAQQTTKATGDEPTAMTDSDEEALPKCYGDIVSTDGSAPNTRTHGPTEFRIVEDEDGHWFMCPKCSVMYKEVVGEAVEDY